MNWKVKKVKCISLYPIRNKVLRKSAGIKYCKFEGDENETSIHLAVIKDDLIIGGVSLIENNSIKLNSKNSIQLRGMCVYDKFQKQNVGLALLNKAEELSKAKNFEYIWMNARKSALKFYLKKGYINNFESFNINNIGKHYFLFKKVK